MATKFRTMADTGVDENRSIRYAIRNVELKRDIEARLRHMAPDLNSRFLHRVIAFSLSGTCLVDLKQTAGAFSQDQQQ